jgi:DNA gyrase subunit A
MENGTTRQITIEQEMRDAFLDYAMSTIVARALPDARDGLKPVHRRILYAMHDMGIRSDGGYKKSARIVGEVLGKYHPHGDSAVYESLVRMAQDFSMRYTLVDGQGNFGSVDGDGAAAMRYTEARMDQVGDELMVDIEKNTVDFTETFDGSLMEPLVLPSAVPNLLVNGATGIAVGMSTNIPPHNLGEVCDALQYMLRRWDDFAEVTTSDLMQFVKGPDFPTGGLVYRHDVTEQEGDDTLVSAYSTGRGKIIIRAKAYIEEMGRGKQRIIVSELPYQVNKSALVDRIATLVRDGRLEGLSDLRDESDRQGLRLVIELQRGVDAPEVLAKLYKLTQLQETFGIIMLALVNGEPRVLSLKQALKVYLDHRLVVIRRRSEYDLQKARARAHILQGLLKAIDVIDAVIKTIRASEDADAARVGLMALLSIDEIQAQAILDMQLRRLAALERFKIQGEYDEKMQLVAYLESLLSSHEDMRAVIAAELTTIRGAYSDQRRTVIVGGTANNASIADLFMPDEPAVITYSSEGRIARMHDKELPKITADTKDPPQMILHGTSNHILYLFTAKGLCATLPVQELPEADTPADGALIHDITSLTNEDEVVGLLSLPPGEENGYLFLTSETGQVKRLRLADLPGAVMKPFVVMNITEDDRLGWVFPTDGRQDIVLTSNQAMSIRFSEDAVRPTGLPAGGMRGIKLAGQRVRIVDASIVLPDAYMITVTDDAIAKLSAMSDYPQQGRAGGGVITMRLPKSSRELRTAGVVSLDDTVYLLSNRGKAVQLKLKSGVPVVARGRAGGDIQMSMPRKDEQVQKLVQIVPAFSSFEAFAENELAPGSETETEEVAE